MQTDNLKDIIIQSIESATRYNNSPASNVLRPGERKDASITRSANNRRKRGRPRKHPYSAWIFSDPFDDREEELLLRNVKAAHEKRQHYYLPYYYEIGRLINAHFNSPCPGDILRIIAARTGVGLNSLRKACQFARKYPLASFDMLIGGPFVICWSRISQNLTVDPCLLIEIYRNSKSPYDYDERIMEIKKSYRNKRRS